MVKPYSIQRSMPIPTYIVTPQISKCKLINGYYWNLLHLLYQNCISTINLLYVNEHIMRQKDQGVLFLHSLAYIKQQIIFEESRLNNMT